MGPGDRADGMGFAALLSVSPRGGETGVGTGPSIHLAFGAPMAPGMERYVDLHLGDLDGPTLAMSCSWSIDRTRLDCDPDEPLHPNTTYWVHLGGGMSAMSGQPVDLDAFGPSYGGRSVSGALTRGHHAGQPWGEMASPWHHAGGGYGIAFPFTTA